MRNFQQTAVVAVFLLLGPIVVVSTPAQKPPPRASRASVRRPDAAAGDLPATIAALLADPAATHAQWA